MSSIVITIPKSIKWTDYEKELSAVEDESQEMHYKIPTLPKDVNVGDRCYLCHDGYIKGWMKISHIGKLDGFECTTTGKDWSEGYYVSRTGPFHYLKNPIPMKGFMGYRKIDDSAINEEKSMTDKIANIVEQATRLVLEDRGSKNLSQARSYLEKSGVEDPQKVIDTIRHDIPNIRLPRKEGKDTYKFLFAACRFFVEKQLTDADSIMEFNQILPYVASDAHVEDYDRNLNNLSLEQIVNQFAGVRKSDIDNQREQSKNNSFDGESQYDIVPIDDFKASSQYAEYVDWCVTRQASYYNSYTHGRRGRFYFCLKKGFEQVPRVKGDNCPLDEYGLSMIAVSITQQGDPNTITCRWNHDNGGNDNIMNVKQLEQVIQRPFFDTFLPFTEQELENHTTTLDYEDYQELVFDNSILALRFTDGTALYYLMQDLDPESDTEDGYEEPDRDANNYAVTDDENRHLTSFYYGRDSIEASVDGVFAILKNGDGGGIYKTVLLAYDDQHDGDVYEYISYVELEYNTEHKFVVFHNSRRYNGDDAIIWNTLESGGRHKIKSGTFLDIRVIDDLRDVNTLVEIQTTNGYSLIDIFANKVLISDKLPKNGRNFEAEWINDDTYTGWVFDTEDGMRVTADGEVIANGESLYPIEWTGYGLKQVYKVMGYDTKKIGFCPLGQEEPEDWFDSNEIKYSDTDGRFALCSKKGEDGKFKSYMLGPDARIMEQYGEIVSYAPVLTSAFGKWFALAYQEVKGETVGPRYCKFYHLDGMSEIKVDMLVCRLKFYNDYVVGFQPDAGNKFYMFSLKDGHILIPEGSDEISKYSGSVARVNGKLYDCEQERFIEQENKERSYLENIIAEALNESSTGTLTLYRGYDKTKGNHNLKSGIWLTPQEEYAKVYARQFGDNGWVAEYTLDKGKLKVMDEATAQRIITDLYEPIEDDINDVFDAGKNAYEFEVNSYDADVLCLLSEEPIISIRDLSQDEFNAIPDEKEQVPKRDTALDNAVERNKGDYATRFKLAADLTSRGWLIHGTNSDFEAFDINKIRGGFRAHEGYGFYFTDMPYKGIDYGSNLKLVRKADFNFLNSKTVIRENNRLYYLFFHALDYLQYELNKANDRLMNVRNNREYDETNAEIENIKNEMAEMDEGVLTVAKSVINQIGSGCTVGQLEYNIPVNYIPRLVAQYVKLGYDGYETDGIYTIFNFEKLNEKFTTLDRIANNEGMERLKNIVNEALADYVEERGDTVIIDNERKNVLYIGVKLDLSSKHTLMNIGEWFVKEKLGWSNYKMFCDHMTIAFRTAITDEIWQWFQDNKGMEDELTVFSFGFSDKACAVEVICHSPSQNQHKHITIATNLDNGGKPVDSNNITNWASINEFRLKGTISEWTR